MPVMTLHILFAPALNALGLPNIVVRNSLFGALLMPSVYLFAVNYGADGLAWGWLVAFPILLIFTIYQARPHIGFTLSGLAGAVVPGFAAAAIMAALVWAVDHMVLKALWPDVPALIHLAVLAVAGGLAYAAMLWFGARATFMEVVNLLVKRKPPEPVTP